MIVTLTLNPALDKSTEMERLIPEKKMRCSELKIEAGGGGINISRAIKELGGDSLAVFTSGGNNGRTIERILNDEGVRFHTLAVADETRENFVATELSSNKQYRFVMPGAAMKPEHVDACKEWLENISNVSYLIMSGSLPPGTTEDLTAEIASIAKRKGIRFIVDTSGKPLKKALGKGVYLLKPNLTELGSLVGKDWLDPSEIDQAAEQIINQGNCEVIVVSMGPAGALLVTQQGKKRIVAPGVKKISTVGAGDSMVAGMVWMLESGETLENAVTFGVACGTAATMNKGTQLFKKEDVLKLYDWMKKN